MAEGIEVQLQSVRARRAADEAVKALAEAKKQLEDCRK
ncbi:hypothetical protein JOF53_007600 [Crossiella equi]|uniref:Uncharacterized protein n=1 Tax=Crossiella equi TaxID=130796 RepID=A0ABS5AQ90_9PSEU|nr:hypothetical protein [Crossiella equi]